MSDDIALCGDPTCESPSCRQSAINAWKEREEQEARDIVRTLLTGIRPDASTQEEEE